MTDSRSVVRHTTAAVAFALLCCVGVAPAAEAPAAEASAAESRFDITEYRVLGNASLQAVDIERAVYPYLGPDKSIADVQGAREQLELAYRGAGYATIFVDIPEQQVDAGIVRLRVTEGRLDRVRVTGARYFSNNQIMAAVPSLATGTVPRLGDLQTELNTLNRRSRDRSVVPVLRAGRTPGTVDVDLRVSDTLPFHGSVEVNNRYTADTSPLRVSGSLSYENLFQRQQSLSLQFQTSPEDPAETRAIVASYTFRAPRLKDTTFALYAVDSKSDIAALGTLSVIGNGRIFGARMIRSLSGSASYYSNLSLGLDYKDFLEDIRLVEDEGLVTPIAYLDWSLDYTGTLRGDDGITATVFNAGANFGIRGIFNDPGEFTDKRFKGKANYFYVKGGMQHLRPLPWGLRLFGRFAGQLTKSPLVSNEQLVLGGVESVRGYLESSHLGDYGINGSVELRSGWPVRQIGLPAESGYVFAFFDAGRVAVIDPLPSQVSRFSLASWGLGLRVADWHGMDLSLDLAQALRDSATVERGDGRAHFSIRYAY